MLHLVIRQKSSPIMNRGTCECNSAELASSVSVICGPLALPTVKAATSISRLSHDMNFARMPHCIHILVPGFQT